jgi:hypothetical protein
MVIVHQSEHERFSGSLMAFKTDLYHSSFWMHELLVALLSLLFLL